MNALFKILMDAAGDAFALSKVVLGTLIDGTINGLAVFGFRDSNGNATMPQLNSEGALPVAFDAGTTIVIPAKIETQVNMESAGENTRVMLGSIALVPDRDYTAPSFDASAFRGMLFELVMVQDVGGADTEELILAGYADAGQYNAKGSLLKDKFSTDATVNTKELRLYATMKDNKAGGDVYGKASVNLVPA